MGVAASDGGSPISVSIFSFDNPETPDGITDSHGHSGLADVLAELTAQFSIPRVDDAGDTYFGFDPDFSLSMRIPGSDSNSVLFIDNSAAATTATPEPSNLVLALIAASVLAGRRINVKMKTHAHNQTGPGKLSRQRLACHFEYHRA